MRPSCRSASSRAAILQFGFIPSTILQVGFIPCDHLHCGGVLLPLGVCATPLLHLPGTCCFQFGGNVFSDLPCCGDRQAVSHYLRQSQWCLSSRVPSCHCLLSFEWARCMVLCFCAFVSQSFEKSFGGGSSAFLCGRCVALLRTPCFVSLVAHTMQLSLSLSFLGGSCLVFVWR